MAEKSKRCTVQLPEDAHTTIKTYCSSKKIRNIGEWLAAVGVDAVNADKKKGAK